MSKFDVITRVDLPLGVMIWVDMSNENYVAILNGRDFSGEIVKESGKFILRERTMTTGRENEFGPTGRFPKVKLYPDDKGELTVGLTIDEEKGVIIMAFGAPMEWLAMRSEEATAFADSLINFANELDKLKTEKENNET